MKFPKTHTLHFYALHFDHVIFPAKRPKSDGRELCQYWAAFLVDFWEPLAHISWTISRGRKVDTWHQIITPFNYFKNLVRRYSCWFQLPFFTLMRTIWLNYEWFQNLSHVTFLSISTWIVCVFVYLFFVALLVTSPAKNISTAVFTKRLSHETIYRGVYGGVLKSDKNTYL